MKTERTKMSDIAKALDISTISVSRALSGQEGVSEDLRARVLQKAGEMGYLRQKNLGDWRVLVLHRKPFIHDNSNYSYLIQDMAKALQEKGCEYDMEFIDNESLEKLTLPIKLLKGARYDGILFIGKFEGAYVNFITQRIHRHVFFTDRSPSGGSDSVWYNFDGGGYLQCRYLMGKGHTRIGYAGVYRDFVGREKVQGIVAALEDAGLEARDDFFIFSENELEKKMLEKITSADGPTAVICQWDYTAVGLIKYLYEHGVRVPDDVSVIGSGNTELSSLCIPTLTTLELHIDCACERAVDLLLRRLENADKPAETVLVSSTLVERNSVAPAVKK